jgi:hypothetical protein
MAGKAQSMMQTMCDMGAIISFSGNASKQKNTFQAYILRAQTHTSAGAR